MQASEQASKQASKQANKRQKTMPVGGVTTAGCKRQAWHSSVRSSSIQRDERDAPRSAQEPPQLETIDVACTFNRRLCMYRLLAIFHPSRFGLMRVRWAPAASSRSTASTDGGHQHPQQRSCLPSVSVFMLGRLGARSLQALSVPSSQKEKRGSVSGRAGARGCSL